MGLHGLRAGYESEPILPDDPWRWRWAMAERLVAGLDGARYGVVACYLIGSAKNACAGPASDLDLLIHVRGSASQHEALRHYCAGWSRLLGLVNHLYTGAGTSELVDVHLVTDEDIRAGDSFAVKIGAVTDGAREIPLR